MKIKVEYNEFAQTENLCGAQQEQKKIDFRQVREKLTEINNLDELNRYWKSLNLTDKQAEVLKVDFAERRVKIGV